MVRKTKITLLSSIGKGINCQCGTEAEAVYFMQGMLFLLLADFRNRKISKNRELIGLNSFHFIYMCV